MISSTLMRPGLIRRLRGSLPLLALLLWVAGCGKDPKPDHNSEPRPRIYVYGDQIGFGYGGDARRFLGDGWTKPEPAFTWTKGLGAWMEVRVSGSDQPLTLKMKLNGLISSPELAYQPVDVSINGRKVASWKVAALKYYTAEVPVDMVRPPSGEANDVGFTTRLLIDFYTPKSISPSDLKLNRDSRRLGICAWEMFLTKGVDTIQESGSSDIPESAAGSNYTYDTPVSFSSAGNSARYKLGGWYDAESLFTWFGKQPALLGFRVAKTEKPLVLKVKLAALTRPPKLTTQPVELSVNGQKLADWQVRGSLGEFSATIPPALANETGVLSVQLVAPRAVTPNSLELSSDLRELGAQCFELTISEQP